MKTPNYHDFYQKALLPIGEKDLLALKESKIDNTDSPSTHWLIAVEGEQIDQPAIYFFWKVSIYPANSDGDFNWKKPYYCSTAYDSMDHAHELASTLVNRIKFDELSSIKLQEKIS